MWKKISNPQWADKDHTAVNCMVKFEHIEQAVPFTATASDTEAYGRDIYAACLRGEAGEIAEYVQPSISPEKARELKTAGINAWRNAMEAANYTFEHNGRKWDYGKSTQTRLEPSVAAAKAGKLPEAFFWTDADNNDVPMDAETLIALSAAKWHLNRSQFGIRIDHDLAFISDHSLASQSITIWHASDH